MDTAWIGLVGALGGVAVGALAESWRSRVSFQREKAWAIYEERRRRLEQVYEALEQVRESYGQGYFNTVHVVRTQRDHRPENPQLKVPWARIRMLVHLYTPELISHLSAVEETGPQLGIAMGNAVIASSANAEQNQKLVNALGIAFKDFTKSINAMRDEIVVLSRELSEQTASLSNKHILK